MATCFSPTYIITSKVYTPVFHGTSLKELYVTGVCIIVRLGLADFL